MLNSKWMVSMEALDRPIYGVTNFSKNIVQINNGHGIPKYRQRVAFFHELCHVLFGPRPTEKGHAQIVDLGEFLASLKPKLKHTREYYKLIETDEGYNIVDYQHDGMTNIQLLEKMIQIYAWYHKIPLNYEHVKQLAEWSKLDPFNGSLEVKCD